MGYVGRFAPSPTGPLHFGSLVAALASFLDARHAGGKWLLRIEDLDPPRESASAPAEIIEQLTRLGLNWDGEVFYQGTRDRAYRDAIEYLAGKGLVYPCTCTRKNTPPVYPGTCRGRNFDDVTEPHAIRLHLRQGSIGFNDRVFDAQSWDIEKEVGDFIIRRKDKLFAYQLAVVVDDHDQGINNVVRGADLLDSTPRQLALYEAFGFPQPDYLHIPILTDSEGHKLSKQAHAKPLGLSDPLHDLRAALRELGQYTQPDCQYPQELLKKAASAWQPALIPGNIEQRAPGTYL